MEAVNNTKASVVRCQNFPQQMTNSLLNRIMRAFQGQFTINLLYVVRDEEFPKPLFGQLFGSSEGIPNLTTTFMCTLTVKFSNSNHVQRNSNTFHVVLQK